MNFMPHGHCYQWTPSILWPMVIGEALHVIAYLGIAGMLFYLCTRELGRASSWMPPFMFLFGCYIFTCAVTHAMDMLTIWVPAYDIQAVLVLLSGMVSLATLVITVGRRKDILEWLGAGQSATFPGSKSYEPRHPPPSDCQGCTYLLNDMTGKKHDAD